MFTSLAGKALIPVGLAVTGFTVVCCLVLYSVIREDLHHGEIVYATNLADTMLKSTRYAMHKSDRETLAYIIRNLGEQKGVDHVRIFNKKGIVSFSDKPGEINRQVDKKTEGCIICHKTAVPVTTLGTMQQARTFKNPFGIGVMAITAPIYNEPDCSSALCHVHPPGQKILGTLDIGLLRGELDSSLRLLRVQMIIFTLMSLILTIGGVTALLMRTVFLPIRKLRNYVETSANEDNPPPPLPQLPDDLRIIGAFYCDLKTKASGNNKNATESVNDLKKVR